MNDDALREKFGKRIKRCPGCFVAYYVRDMYLDEEGTLFCETCKTDEMFHFDDFSRAIDLSLLPSLRDEE